MKTYVAPDDLALPVQVKNGEWGQPSPTPEILEESDSRLWYPVQGEIKPEVRAIIERLIKEHAAHVAALAKL